MSIAVVGCGRSGTNMILEILAGNSQLLPTTQSEDKALFTRGKAYGNGRLAKCHPVYFGLEDFNRTMDMNPEMQVVWTMRDPRDMILSKIKRGQPRSKGGDNKILSEDATPSGCITSIKEHVLYYSHALTYYSGRVHLAKMEDFLEDIESATKTLCCALGLPYKSEMLDFMSRMRNPDKKKRYKGVDKKELAKWRNWETCYDGFFLKGDYDILGLFAAVKPIVDEFEYGGEE